jgi:hypothetical protein
LHPLTTILNKDYREIGKTDVGNMKKNVDFISEPADEWTVKDVEAIIGEQMRETWKNT